MSFDDLEHPEDDYVSSCREEGKLAPRRTTTREAGRKGGQTVREKYGSGYFAAIGKKGGTALKARAAPDHFSQLGKQGGQTTKTRYGPEHYRALGKKGGAALKARDWPGYYQNLGKLGGTASRQSRRRTQVGNVLGTRISGPAPAQDSRHGTRLDG